MQFIKALALAFTLGAPMAVSATESAPFNGTASADSLFVATSGEVILTFLSKDANYFNDLFLAGVATPILNNQTAVSGTQYSLGTFEAGTLLSFSMFVNNTNTTFFNGAAALNSDNTIHAAYGNLIGNTITVGFEDILFGGDKDYNDLVFSLNNVYAAPTQVTPVSEPETYAMLVMGLGLMGWASQRRSSK